MDVIGTSRHRRVSGFHRIGGSGTSTARRPHPPSCQDDPSVLGAEQVKKRARERERERERESTHMCYYIMLHLVKIFH